MLSTISSIIGIIKDLFKGISFITDKLKKRKSKAEEIPRGDNVLGMARRFVEIYKAHGVERTQIPRLLGKEFGFNLIDVGTDEKLLEALSEGIIIKTCETFGVRREWLEGKDVPIYPYLTFYKNLKAFIDLIAKLKHQYSVIQLLMIKCSTDKLCKEGERLPIAVLLRCEVAHWGHFSEDSIWKYLPLSDTYYYWEYEITRLHLKAMTLIAWQFNIHIGGCQLPQKDIEAIVAGTVLPGPLVSNLHHVAWHPDDYIFANGESGVVADHNEALLVREFLEKNDCIEKLISITGPIKAPYMR